MAVDERKNYPMMATPHWWSLRRKFRAAIPKEVTANYLASALGMAEKSARGNILPSLRTAGIIDKDSKPTDLAVRWRDDAQYAAVCKEIRETVYPQELLDLAPDSSASRSSIQSWFANHTGLGASGAFKMTSFYTMLLEADPGKQTDGAVPSNGQSAKPAKNSRTTARTTPAQPPSPAVPTQPAVNGKRSPELHINVQVHIAADANADQIDAIFSSMAKYLKELS